MNIIVEAATAFLQCDSIINVPEKVFAEYVGLVEATDNGASTYDLFMDIHNWLFEFVYGEFREMLGPGLNKLMDDIAADGKAEEIARVTEGMWLSDRFDRLADFFFKFVVPLCNDEMTAVPEFRIDDQVCMGQ